MLKKNTFSHRFFSLLKKSDHKCRRSIIQTIQTYVTKSQTGYVTTTQQVMLMARQVNIYQYKPALWWLLYSATICYWLTMSRQMVTQLNKKYLQKLFTIGCFSLFVFFNLVYSRTRRLITDLKLNGNSKTTVFLVENKNPFLKC